MRSLLKSIAIATLGLIVIAASLQFHTSSDSEESEIGINIIEEQEPDLKEILKSYENGLSTLEEEPDPGEYPRPKTISVFTIRHSFVQGEFVDIFIRNNRNVEIK
jgi:hypothetical protein